MTKVVKRYCAVRIMFLCVFFFFFVSFYFSICLFYIFFSGWFLFPCSRYIKLMAVNTFFELDCVYGKSFCTPTIDAAHKRSVKKEKEITYDSGGEREGAKYMCANPEHWY